MSPLTPWPLLGPLGPFVSLPAGQPPPSVARLDRGAREPSPLVFLGMALLGIALAGYYRRSRRAPPTPYNPGR
jgi:hypothetical protein